MAVTWAYRFKVSGPTHQALEEAATAEWRKYRDMPDAALPWNTEVKVHQGDATAEYEAEVSVSWDSGGE